MMAKMMEMLLTYEVKASEVDNSTTSIKNQFEKKLQAVQAENHKLTALMKKPEGKIGEKMRGRSKWRKKITIIPRDIQNGLRKSNDSEKERSHHCTQRSQHIHHYRNEKEKLEIDEELIAEVTMRLGGVQTQTLTNLANMVI